jgi:hypothetical protein
MNRSIGNIETEMNSSLNRTPVANKKVCYNLIYKKMKLNNNILGKFSDIKTINSF